MTPLKVLSPNDWVAAGRHGIVLPDSQSGNVVAPIDLQAALVLKGEIRIAADHDNPIRRVMVWFVVQEGTAFVIHLWSLHNRGGKEVGTYWEAFDVESLEKLRGQRSV